MAEMEEKIFESTMETTKNKVQIIPTNFDKTYKYHMSDKKKRETMS